MPPAGLGWGALPGPGREGTGQGVNGLQSRSWCQTDQTRAEKDDAGGGLGTGGCQQPQVLDAHAQDAQSCSIHAKASLPPMLGRFWHHWGCSCSLCLLHTPCPSPAARRREALEPVGPWGDAKQLEFVAWLYLPSTLILPKQDGSALSLCRSHQCYKNLSNTEGK